MVKNYNRKFNQQISNKALYWLTKFLPIPFIIVLWWFFTSINDINPQLFPSPFAVLKAFVEMIKSGQLWSDIYISGLRAFIGYSIGCFIGVLIGVFTGRIRYADQALGKIIHILRSFPPVAIVPFAILWFGIAEAAKYFLVFWGVFFPVWINTHAGMSQVDKTYTWAALSLGAKRKHMIKDILLPAALPHILTGMRVAIGICFICVFVAEMSGAYEGVGFRISTSYLIFRVDKMIAALLVLGAMGATADQLFKMITRYFFPWTKLNNK